MAGPDATTDAPPAPGSRRRDREQPTRVVHTALVTYLFAAVMASTTLPTPLYAIYAGRLGLSPLLVTVIFAVYAVGVLGTLILLGGLSDHVGRRTVLLLAVALSAASGVVFATTSDLPALFVGRVLSGISAGLMTGAITAYLTEIEARRPGTSRAGFLATVANIGGLGLGPLIAGPLADHVPAPTVVPYLVGLALLLPVVLVPVVRLPETAGDEGGWSAGTRPQRLGVPRDIRVPFAAAAIAALASFSLLGFSTALAGQVLAAGIGDRSHQTVGLAVALLLGSAATAQVLAGRLPVRGGGLTGLVVLPVGVVVVVLAVVASSLPVLLIGLVAGGFGVGLAFRSGLARVTAIAPAERRGEVLSTFFTAGYLGLTVPVVAGGLLVTATTLLTATIALAVFVGVLSAVAAVIVARTGDDA